MFFTNMLSQLPTVILCVVGIVLLARRRAVAPHAANWAIAGFGCTAGGALLSPIFTGLLMLFFLKGELPSATMTLVMSLSGMLLSGLQIAGYGLFLYAFFQFLRPRET